MARGRPKKPAGIHHNDGPLVSCNNTKRANALERKEFEELPKGWRPVDAISILNANEVCTLQKEAYGQSERFEVLRAEDVRAMAKELRHLDERSDYLRNMYADLRASRRELHTATCEFLRSSPAARVNRSFLLRQEGLSQLDESIDEWAAELEQTDHQRISVRQKLLEHIAAATTLPASSRQAAAATDVAQL